MKKTKKIIALFLAVMLLALPARTALADTKTDISNIVNITEFSLTANGKEINEQNPAIVGSTIAFTVKWHISAEQFLGKYQAGDYFYIDLPVDYFEFTATEISNTLTYNNELIAIYGLTDDNRLYVELTEAGVRQTKLSGAFIFDGILVADSNGDGSGSVNIGNLEKEFPIAEPVPIPPDEEYPGSNEESGQKEFDKYAAYSGPGSKKIDWYIRLNRDRYYNQAVGTDITVQKNVVIEDELDNGLTLTGLSLEAVLNRPLDDTGKPSSLQATSAVPFFTKNGNTNTDYINSTEVLQNENETYEDFRSRVISVSGVSYGIYQNDNGKTTVIVSLGDLPGNGITYENLFETHYHQNDFKDNLKSNNSSLTSAELDTLDKIWGKDNAIDGQITYVRLHIITEGQLDETYKNKATLTTDNDSKETEEVIVKTKSLDGFIIGGAAGSVHLYKKDADNGQVIDGAKFKNSAMAR